MCECRIKYESMQLNPATCGYELKIMQIDIELKEQVLTISYRKQDEITEDVLHKGLAHRSFTRSFNLAEDIKVKKAKLNNGLLSIILERIIPEDKKPVKIKIS